jgi:peptide/nickel transport system permease protein
MADGRILVAPKVSENHDTLLVHGLRQDREIDRDEVVHMQKVRFLLGSDRFGGDVLHDLLVGGRISLAIAALAALTALLVGTVIGLVSATGGPVVDMVLMRLVDALLAFPVLFLMILIAALFRPGPFALIAILGLVSWMGLSRLIRGQVMSLRSRPFILAARAAGCTQMRIWRTHYLPHLVGPVSQDTALRLGALVLAEATLSYLGLGVPPDVPTWGAMVAQGHRVMVNGWWLATFPGLAIAALVISLALVGDGLQERLDDPGSRQP